VRIGTLRGTELGKESASVSESSSSSENTNGNESVSGGEIENGSKNQENMSSVRSNAKLRSSGKRASSGGGSRSGRWNVRLAGRGSWSWSILQYEKKRWRRHVRWLPLDVLISVPRPRHSPLKRTLCLLCKQSWRMFGTS
jgi:hypothetical protein